MVNSVRLKVTMRLRAFLERWEQTYNDTPVIQAVVAQAQLDYKTAKDLSEQFRGELQEQFPGCEITVGGESIYVKLPKRYPAHQVPITGQLTSVMMLIARPKGLSMKGF